MTIPTRVLGRTGERVTVLGFGAMELRGAPAGPEISDEDAGRLLNEVLDAGINLIDTSIDYGASEELMGRYLGSRRDEYFLASKCGCAVGQTPGSSPGAIPHDFSAANVRAGVEQSLVRLGTDRLDLVQLHASPSRSEMEKEGTIDELHRLKDEGKIRFIGMSGTLPHLMDHIEMGVFDVFQIPYSALQPEHDEVISIAADAGAGVLIHGGAARGTAAEDKNWTVQPFNASGAAAEDRWQSAELDQLLDEGMSRHEFILRFTISHPGLSSTIVGARDSEHLSSNVAIAAKGPLPVDVYAEARRRLGLAPI